MINLALLRYAGPVAAAFLIFGAGWQVADWRADARHAASVERAIKQAAEIAAQDAEILGHAEVRAAATEARFRTINREVIRYVDTHDPVDCLQPDGVRVWNDANAGADAPVAAEPGATVPAPAVNRYRAIRERFAQSRRDGAVVSPMPGPTSSPGELVNPEGVTP